ncbi:uncharacterized protein LOC125675777 isoform X2 [Ostrea edulis]|uniref:uncharacterized protein LOC125675777 isoform X2 n=1 Tax=Ostrea edulis TaxID=37623 RepID=UPI0024AFC42C|nr:uncharacterized protein LOC125675777 isoform X2 [Ostrea edulis]
MSKQAQAPSELQSQEDEVVQVEAVPQTSQVVYKLRDIGRGMVSAWKSRFPSSYKNVQVSPANSFGCMDGGIDMVYSRHFGWQMQNRLQKVIREELDGEILVGQAVIIPAYEEENPPKEEDLKGCNEGAPIKYLVSAPTMRVPQSVENTVNAYLAFRAVVLAVQKHNARNPDSQIRSVLCPGLGTAVGMMDFKQCAQQMCLAYETHELKLPEHRFRVCPDNLWIMEADQEKMIKVKVHIELHANLNALYHSGMIVRCNRCHLRK